MDKLRFTYAVIDIRDGRLIAKANTIEQAEARKEAAKEPWKACIANNEAVIEALQNGRTECTQIINGTPRICHIGPHDSIQKRKHYIRFYKEAIATIDKEYQIFNMVAVEYMNR